MKPRVSRSQRCFEGDGSLSRKSRPSSPGLTLDEIQRLHVSPRPFGHEDYIVALPTVNSRSSSCRPHAETQRSRWGARRSAARSKRRSKGVLSLELGSMSDPHTFGDEEDGSLAAQESVSRRRRMWALFKALERGWGRSAPSWLTNSSPWFLQQFTKLRAAPTRAIQEFREFRLISSER